MYNLLGFYSEQLKIKSKININRPKQNNMTQEQLAEKPMEDKIRVKQ